MANSQKKSPTSESSTHINPKVSVDEEDALTADFNDKEENPWMYCTEWTCKAFPLECDIQLRHGILKHLCDIRHQFDVNQGVKLMNLCNTKQKVILVFGHDTKDNALNLITTFVDVRSTVLEFIRKVDRNVEDIRVSVRLRGQNKPEEQQDTGTKCLFESMQLHSQQNTSETTWFCKPDKRFAVADHATSNRYFTALKDNISRKFRASLRTCQRGCVKFIVHHVNINDAVKMIIKHEEVSGMMLACLQGIDSTVKDIQIEVQLRDFIDPPPLLELRHLDKRYVNKQEHEQVVADLRMIVSSLGKQQTETLNRLFNLEQSQLAGTRISMMMLRDDTSQTSESSGIYTESDTKVKGDEEDTEATSREEQTLKSGTPQRPYTRATTTSAGSIVFHDACMVGNLGCVQRFLATDRAHINGRDKDGKTPVMMAAQYGQIGVLGFLVNEGADLSLTDGVGNTILHCACLGGDAKTVKFVLSLKGADINATNNEGKRALNLAKSKGHHHLMDLLVTPD